MPHAKPAVALSAVAILLCGCSSTVNPPQGRGKVDDPRIDNPNHVACLLRDKLPIQLVDGTVLQIGPLPSGPTVEFEPTPGAAQSAQLQGQAQGAEVIGSALLYPHAAGDAELGAIESCLAVGVTG
jgi:hypothetical protein